MLGKGEESIYGHSRIYLVASKAAGQLIRLSPSPDRSFLRGGNGAAIDDVFGPADGRCARRDEKGNEVGDFRRLRRPPRPCSWRSCSCRAVWQRLSSQGSCARQAASPSSGVPTSTPWCPPCPCDGAALCLLGQFELDRFVRLAPGNLNPGAEPALSSQIAGPQGVD